LNRQKKQKKPKSGSSSGGIFNSLTKKGESSVAEELPTKPEPYFLDEGIEGNSANTLPTENKTTKPKRTFWQRLKKAFFLGD